MATSAGSIRWVSLGRARCGALRWRWRGAQHLTVIVQASFRWAEGADMLPVDPEPLASEDQHQDGNPARSLRRVSDRVPLRPEVDVLLAATAHPPAGQPVSSMAVRLAVFRSGEAQLDKTLHVFGNRSPREDASSGPPAAFASMPLCYERALQDEDNPHGVRARRKLPNIVYPERPDRSAGLGPLSPYAAVRAVHLGTSDRRSLEAAELLLGEDLDWRYFQVAPLDQRVGWLRGDEEIVLDGMHPALARTWSRLPGAMAEAYLAPGTPQAAAALAGATAGQWLALPLRLDTLRIDADAGLVTIAWRGHVPLMTGQDEPLPDLVLAAGVGLPGEALSLPPVAEAHERAGAALPTGAWTATAGAPLPGDPRDRTCTLLGPEPPAPPSGTALPSVPRAAPASAGPPGAPYGPRLERSVQAPTGDETVALSGGPPYPAAGTLPAAIPRGLGETRAVPAPSSPAVAIAPFPLAAPGAGVASGAAPPGAPFGTEIARDVPEPVGDQTLDLRAAVGVLGPRAAGAGPYRADGGPWPAPDRLAPAAAPAASDLRSLPLAAAGPVPPPEAPAPAAGGSPESTAAEGAGFALPCDPPEGEGDVALPDGEAAPFGWDEPDADLFAFDAAEGRAPPAPGVLAGDALAAALRRAHAPEEQIAAVLAALSPPRPPPDEDEA